MHRLTNRDRIWTCKPVREGGGVWRWGQVGMAAVHEQRWAVVIAALVG